MTMENVACTSGSAVGGSDVEVLKCELDEAREIAEIKQIELEFASLDIPDEVTITRERLARLCVYLGCHDNEELTRLAAGVIRHAPDDFDAEVESAADENDA
jgi:1,4-dihydroxy-2-naphthoyl-CoA synthase